MNTRGDEQEAVDLAVAYLETAMRMLDEGNVGVAQAALRRVAEALMRLPRWDAVNGGNHEMVVRVAGAGPSR